MTIVMEMSTDQDIVRTSLNVAWNPITNRYNWTQVKGMNLNIPRGETIVVIAHGNGDEIGNANPGQIDIDAETFLALIQSNVQGAPKAIYISTCGTGIAKFAAGVRRAAQNNQIWNNTQIFGHSDPVAGSVPPPNDIRWVEIFPSRRSTKEEKEGSLSSMISTELDQLIAIGPDALLDDVLTNSKQGAFQDSDGLISFVNMSSSLVQNDHHYSTGREVCDKISNFFATMRLRIFAYLKNNPSKVLPGDTVPQTQWDPAVTHYMQFLLTQAGGLTNYKVITETYSVTQAISEFSTDLIKLIFDATVAPEDIVSDVLKFVQGVGQSLRVSWDDRSKNYGIALLSQCHEAVPVHDSGDAVVYFPKVKYYFISVDSSQQAFTSNCAKVEKLTFNFKYESYVTGLKASILDKNSKEYKKFVRFLDKAQNTSYKDASNNLDEILADTKSDLSPVPDAADEENVFGVDYMSYPVIDLSAQRVEGILNRPKQLFG